MREGILVRPLSVLSDSGKKRLFLPAAALFFFALFLLFPLLFTHSDLTVQVTLAWDPNTEVNLAGYRIYYKTSTPGAPYDGSGANEGDSPIDVPLALLTDKDNPEYKLTGLSNTKIYYFAVTAYNREKRESGYSGEVSTGSTTSAESTGGSGGGGGGGCFIATAASGSKMEYNGHALIILSGLAVLNMALTFVFGLRHRMHHLKH